MSSGGGGQSGQTRYDWNDVIGSYWGGAPGPDGKGGGGVLGWAAEEAQRPYQQYGERRIAGRNTDQYTAAQRVRDQAAGYGNTDVRAGRIASEQMAGGALRNDYSGENPYFKSMVANANQDTANAYKQGTSADLTRLMNMSGAFGGTAHTNALANNEAGLAKQLGNQTTSMYGQQYDRSANMDEARLGRQLSAIPLAFQGQGLSNEQNDRLMGIGKWEQDEQQKYADQNYNDWTQQQNWGRNNVNWLSSLLGGAQGSTGIQTQFGGYQGPNGFSQAAGLGLLGASMFGGRGGG